MDASRYKVLLTGLLLASLIAPTRMVYAEEIDSVSEPANPSTSGGHLEVETELDPLTNLPAASSQSQPLQQQAPTPSAKTIPGISPTITVTEAMLKRRIDFWVSVYTKYSTSEGVIHDAKYPEIVLERLD